MIAWCTQVWNHVGGSRKLLDSQEDRAEAAMGREGDDADEDLSSKACHAVELGVKFPGPFLVGNCAENPYCRCQFEGGSEDLHKKRRENRRK